MIVRLIYLLTFASSYAQKNGANDSNLMPSVTLKPTQVEKQNITDTPQRLNCVTKYEEEGVCVHYYWCSHLFGDDRNHGIIDTALPYNDGCDFYEVCCRHDRAVPINIAETIEKADKRCGQHNPDGVGLIDTQRRDRTKANFGEFPWNVAVFAISRTNENEFIGTGSLIHPSVVLTSAYFVRQHLQLRIRAGEWDSLSEGEIFQHQDRDIKDILLHADFKLGPPDILANDVALLFLNEPVDLSLPHIGVVCLPQQNNRPVAGTRCLMSSWRKDFGKGPYVNLLRRDEVLIVNSTTCEEQLRKTRIGKDVVLSSSSFCGTVGDTQGSSGAPLVCPVQDTKDRYVQNGIASWGIGGEPKPPSVFVDVARFRTWIDENVASHGYDPSTYSYTV